MGGNSTFTFGGGTFSGLIEDTQGTLNLSDQGHDYFVGCKYLCGHHKRVAGTLTLSMRWRFRTARWFRKHCLYAPRSCRMRSPSAALLAAGLSPWLTAATPDPVALSVGSNNTSNAYSGVLSGAGSLTNIGIGALTSKAGENNYSGGTLARPAL